MSDDFAASSNPIVNFLKSPYMVFAYAILLPVAKVWLEKLLVWAIGDQDQDGDIDKADLLLKLMAALGIKDSNLTAQPIQ